MPNTKLEKNESFPDLSVWDFEKCLKSEKAESNINEEGLLLRTLTGHGGLVHSIFATSFGLISCDITGLIFERDFWKCIQVCMFSILWGSIIYFFEKISIKT